MINDYIIDKSELKEVWNTLDKIFYIDRNFPDQVFHSHFVNFKVMEYPVIFSDDFWEGYQKSRLFQPNDVITVISMDKLNPDIPTSKDRCYKISASSSPDTYGELSYRESEMIRDSHTAVHFSSSLKWAIWSSWELELSMIGFNKDLDADKIPLNSDWFPVNNEWMTIQQAISDILVNSVKPELRDERSKVLLQNYAWEN